jgi:hypothetical protein
MYLYAKELAAIFSCLLIIESIKEKCVRNMDVSGKVCERRIGSQSDHPFAPIEDKSKVYF